MIAPKPEDLRDPRLDAAWREASREEPSAALDEAILAAARREVGAGPVAAGSETGGARRRDATRATHVPEATRPERWWWPLAAAATIGAIAFGLLQLKPVENGGPSVVSDMPAPATKRAEAPVASVQPPVPDRQATASMPPPPTTPAPPPVTRGVPAAPPAAGNAQAPPAFVASKTPAVPQAAGTSSARIAVADTPSAFPAAAAPPPPQGEPAVLAKVEEARGSAERVRETAGARATEARAPAPASKVAVRQEAARQEAAPHDATLPVAEWIAKIRRLRDEGKSDEAVKELAAFRVAYPDHEQRLPPDLRNWRVPAK